jgi:prevent-host-death family protein
MPSHEMGVRALKARLSSCLKRVRAGERVTITDRRRPIAVIVPIDEPPSVGWAHRLAASGGARWAGGKPSGLAPRVPSRGKAASRMVLDDRR